MSICWSVNMCVDKFVLALLLSLTYLVWTFGIFVPLEQFFNIPIYVYLYQNTVNDSIFIGL